MYIELHARSAFSFLEGASVPEELAEVCAQHQMPAMALLDRDGVYGAPRFYLAAKKLKIKAHIGAEITSLLPLYRGEPSCAPRFPTLRLTRGLPEPLPPGHSHEIACTQVSSYTLPQCKTPQEEQHSPAPSNQLLAGRPRRICYRIDLHDWRRGRPAGACVDQAGLEAGRRTLE